ncbi:MAG: hypothetical protein AAGF27_05660 [Pseudomonadota bacterium]
MSLLLRFLSPAKQCQTGAEQARSEDCIIAASLDAQVLRHAGLHGLKIACPSPTAEDTARDLHRLRGQFLARQDMWSDLSAAIQEADHTLAMTPAGMPVADLLSYGARSDVVAAVEHVLSEGRPFENAPLLDGIEALEAVLSEAPNDPILAATVAHTHMDIGWAWRGGHWLDQVPTRKLLAFEAHFDRAREILAGLPDLPSDSAFVQGARCALNASGMIRGADIAREYEDLIALNPKTPAPMRALGNYLTPKWYGSYETLELAARRVAGRTHNDWAAGGYTWVMLDALTSDLDVCGILDTAFFVEGLEDILTRHPDQHTVNTLVAFCAHSLGARRGTTPQVESVRSRLAACADWIIRSHLTELHPLVWAHAAAGFDNSLPVRSPRRFAAKGQQDGLRAIAALFQSDIDAGRQIIFTTDGPIAEHP